MGVSKWQAFWRRVLSIETARFILALMALNFSAFAVLMLMTGYARIDADKAQVVNFALGQLFALTMIAFHRYFGRAGEEQASGKPEDPVHVEEDTPRPLPRPTFGQQGET